MKINKALSPYRVSRPKMLSLSLSHLPAIILLFPVTPFPQVADEYNDKFDMTWAYDDTTSTTIFTLSTKSPLDFESMSFYILTFDIIVSGRKMNRNYQYKLYVYSSVDLTS